MMRNKFSTLVYLLFTWFIYWTFKRGKDKFTVLSLNSQSLHAKFNKLEILIHELREINFEFSAICIQETWLDDNSDTGPFQLENYNCIPQGRYSSAHGGLIIYLHNNYNYNIMNLSHKSDTWEGLFIDILPS